MQTTEITEDMIFECFAAASQHADSDRTAESFVDVEEYENQIMYPEFARWAEKAGYHDLATLFRRMAGEEKLHAVWLRKLYTEMGVPSRGEDTQRAIDALQTIRANCDSLIGFRFRCGDGSVTLLPCQPPKSGDSAQMVCPGRENRIKTTIQR